MKKLLLVIASALVFLMPSVIAPTSAQALNIETNRSCTSDFGNGYKVCVKVEYNDKGSVVTLRRMDLFVINPRTGARDDGWAFDRLYVSCVSAGGSLYYWFDPSLRVEIGSDYTSFPINPANTDCSESSVKYGGTGIQIRDNALNATDYLGAAGGNYLPTP